MRTMSLWGCIPAMTCLVAGGVLGLAAGRSAHEVGLAFTEDPTRLIVYGASYVLALLWIVSHRTDFIAIAKRTWPVWLLMAFAASSVAWSAFPTKTVVDCGHLIGAALVAYSLALAVRGSGYAIALVVLVSLGIAIAISLLAVQQGWSVARDPETLRWAGAAGNPNSLGLISAVSIWAAAVTFFGRKNLTARLLAVLVAALAVIALHGSGSATSLIVAALMAGGVIWTFTAVRSGQVYMSRRLLTAAALGTATLLLLLVTAPHLLQAGAGLQAVGRSANFTGRTELWMFALDQFQVHPIRGHGFDSLASVLAKLNSPLGQMHNGYLDLLVRGGLIAICLFVLQMLRTCLEACSAPQAPATASLFMLILGILVHNITESSIVRPAHPLWLLLLVAVAAFAYQRVFGSASSLKDLVERTAQPPGAPITNLLR